MATFKTPLDFLSVYAEGWTQGYADKILRACVPGYVFTDPGHDPKQVTYENFREYLEGLKATVRGKVGTLPIPFMKISHVIIADTLLVACCWWEIPGSGIAGTGLIEVSRFGVESEKVDYQG